MVFPQPHYLPWLNQATAQAAPFRHNPPSTPELHVPVLEPVYWSDDDAAPAHPAPSTSESPFLVFLKSPSPPPLSPNASPPVPQLSQLPHEFFALEDAACDPDTLERPSHTPSPNVADARGSAISDADGRDRPLLRGGAEGLQRDLLLCAQTLGHNQSICQQQPQQQHARNATVPAYVPPLDLRHGGTRGGAGPSNVAHPLNQLRDVHVQQRQNSGPVSSSIRFAPGSSMMRIQQQLRQPPRHPYFTQHQRQPYMQEQGVCSVQTTPSGPAASRLSNPGHLRDGAVTKATLQKASYKLLGKIRCKECPEVFESKLNAMRHMGSCHTKKKKTFPCKYCSASYRGSGARTLHMTRAHPQFVPQIPVVRPNVLNVDGELRYFCWVQGCTKSYTVENNLKRHYKMHHLNIRYPCICGKESTTKSNLQAHQTTCRVYQAQGEEESCPEEP